MSTSLLHSPADVLRWLLVAHGLGSDPTSNPLGPWPVYVASEPDMPDNCLTVYDTAWQDDGRDMATGERHHHHGMQVRVRSVDHGTGFTKAEAVRKALDEDVDWETVVVPGSPSRSYCVQCFSGTRLIVLGKEVPATKRRIFTVNCMAPIRPLY